MNGNSGSSVPLDDRGLPRGYPFKRELEVTPRELKEMLASGRVVVVDVRTGPELEAASIPGVIHIPLDELERRHDEIEREPGQALAVLCHHGVRSMRGALLLRAVGFADAVSVAGGIDAWSLGADAGTPRYERSAGVCRRL